MLAVSVLKAATGTLPPDGTLELQVLSKRNKPATVTYFLKPEKSAADLFLALGNAVPSHATSEELWHLHMRSRPVTSGRAVHEYCVGHTLGAGTFGKVKLAQRLSDGKTVAIKCLSRSRIVLAAQGERLGREIRLLKMLNHPNVIRLYEVLHTPSEILMVMEYAEGGDLLDVINTKPKLKEDQVRHIFGQICRGVAFCHSLGVAHRDLKPENILLARLPDGNNRVCVADFGLSTLMDAGGFLSTSCGSPHYVAPEILNFDGKARYDGRESDVWSLGVIFHVLLCYKLPFEADSTALLYKKIWLGLPSLPSYLNAAAAELLHRMLEVIPEKRISLDEVTKSDYLNLEMETPLLSLAVDAVVDENLSVGSDGSSDVISGSNLRLSMSRTSSSAAASTEPAVRRAFTFDALPPSFHDPDGGHRYALSEEEEGMDYDEADDYEAESSFSERSRMGVVCEEKEYG